MDVRALGPGVGSSHNMVEARDALLVTTDPMTRESAVAALRAAGYQPSVVADAWAAIRDLQVRRYDLLVTDLHPPVLSALDLLHVIRNAGLSIPVVVLREPRSAVPAEALEALGRVTVLDLPFSPAQLADAARRAMESANTGRG